MINNNHYLGQIAIEFSQRLDHFDEVRPNQVIFGFRTDWRLLNKKNC